MVDNPDPNNDLEKSMQLRTSGNLATSKDVERLREAVLDLINRVTFEPKIAAQFGKV